MAVRRKLDIIVVIGLVLSVVAYGASRSQFRLRPDMPVEFFDGSRLPPVKRALEEKIARAYWNCAVKQVQWKYGYASRLPDDPPPEFSISASEIGPVAKDEAVRRRYWQQLRANWNISNAWESQFEWSSVSFRQSLREAMEWWGRVARDFLDW
jgi:hypothetical protein